MRLALIAVLALAAVRAAAAECPKPKGKPLYRQERGPRQVDPGTPAPEPTEVLALYPGGAWTFVTDGEGIAPQSGCIPAAAMREVTAAIGRAKFAHPRGPVTTCAALPTSRITYAAPRRGKKLSVDAPCGIPLDLSTRRLVACVEAARQPSPPDDATLRRVCKGA